MKSFAACLFFLACLLAYGRNARACTCVGYDTVAEQLAAADYAFAGTVVAVDTVDLVFESGSMRDAVLVATVGVEQVWKGNVPERFEVASLIGTGRCEYRLAAGTKYVLYAYEPGSWVVGRISTSKCTRNARYADAAVDLAALGPGYAPVAAEDRTAVPLVSSLDDVYPNPASAHVVLSFALARPGAVELAVYDLLGREAAVVAAGYYGAGRHTVHWEAARVPAGPYLCRLRSGGRTVTRRVVVAR